LPDEIELDNGYIHTLRIWKEDSEWIVAYEDCYGNYYTQIRGNTEAEARGKMWCYLREKKLI